jgi:hypothetical protein
MIGFFNLKLFKLVVCVWFCLLIFLPQAFHFAFVNFLKYKIKKEVKIYLANNELEEEIVKFKFAISEVETAIAWEEKNHEFEFQEMMYDIIRSEIYGDSITYYCFLDSKESIFKQKLNSFSQKNLFAQQEKKKIDHLLIEYLETLFFNESNSFLFAHFSNILKNENSTEKPIQILKEIPVPPPKDSLFFLKA